MLTLVRRVLSALAFASATLLHSVFAAEHIENPEQCLEAGQWALQSSEGIQPVTATDVLAQASNDNILLLGESHDNADHHLWQLQVLGMLTGVHDEIVIGMEMFPRRVQPVLDRWVDGELSESQLLKQSEWSRVWGFDPDLYLPILHFARINAIPIVALNVERSVVSEIGSKGLASVPTDRREGVSEPSPGSAAYIESLRSTFHQHGTSGDSTFDYFVQAQLFWDRAFAQALDEAARERPTARIVGIIGSGHLRYGHGVAHQLRSMGQRQVKVWLPVNPISSCDQLAGLADSVFALKVIPGDTPPRLGVYLRDDAQGVSVIEVVPGSVAEGAGVVSGDRFLTAAGVSIQASDDVIAIVRRQSPGTWLPITLQRAGEKIDLIAKFPAPD